MQWATRRQTHPNQILHVAESSSSLRLRPAWPAFGCCVPVADGLDSSFPGGSTPTSVVVWTY